MTVERQTKTFATIVQRVPQQALSPVTASGNQHDQSVLNIDDNAKDSFGKVLFILKEFITVFNSLGDIENPYNRFKNCTTDLEINRHNQISLG
ncbi:hypothetical protein CDAR_470921 [Caerostris darwini]|uniref:Uncharacterized protein n=1 Tax=Caerostris darwini TaxID=1538125 RepID=A0AAV4W9R5_9ARAC|nr:hypothetical protein CDAR_470921 [Caerostris darwini]